VTNAHIKSVQLVALQNQLLLAIGGTLNAREAMLSFMKLALKQLDLKSMHIYVFDDAFSDDRILKRYQSTPNVNTNIDTKTILDSLLKSLDNTQEKPHASEALDGSEITAFPFGSSGLIILEKSGDTLLESIKEVLAPVIAKLAYHYNVCIQQQLLDEETEHNKAALLTYKQQAKRDPLTKLPNRRELHYSLSKEISNAQRYNHYGALMYIDLDNFKNVNDSLGHSIGDILLTLVAQRLSEQKRAGDVVFRIGGDEFVYILSNVGDTEAEAMSTSITVANRIIDSLAKPLDINEYSLHVTPSIGITTFHDTFED